MENRDLERAKQLLLQEGWACVLCRGEELHTGTAHGVRPLLQFLESGTDLQGFSAADRVIGKAAALLLLYAGVKAVYSPTMSEEALRVLREHGVSASCDQTVPGILNRTKTGPCPMEACVAEIEDPQKAFFALREKAAAMRAAAKPAVDSM